MPPLFCSSPSHPCGPRPHAGGRNSAVAWLFSERPCHDSRIDAGRSLDKAGISLVVDSNHPQPTLNHYEKPIENAAAHPCPGSSGRGVLAALFGQRRHQTLRRPPPVWRGQLVCCSQRLPSTRFHRFSTWVSSMPTGMACWTSIHPITIIGRYLWIADGHGGYRTRRVRMGP